MTSSAIVGPDRRLRRDRSATGSCVGHFHSKCERTEEEDLDLLQQAVDRPSAARTSMAGEHRSGGFIGLIRRQRLAESGRAASGPVGRRARSEKRDRWR